MLGAYFAAHFDLPCITQLSSQAHKYVLIVNSDSIAFSLYWNIIYSVEYLESGRYNHEKEAFMPIDAGLFLMYRL